MDAKAEAEFRAWAAIRLRRLQQTAFLLVGDWHSAEDLVQEALARTALHWAKVTAADSPDAYVRRIMLNEAQQSWRRRARRPQISPLRSEPVTGDDAEERADRDQLMQALRELPGRQRAVIVLRYFDQLSEAETAAALGCSVGTVKSQTHRGVSALRRGLSAEEQRWAPSSRGQLRLTRPPRCSTATPTSMSKRPGGSTSG